MGLAQLVSNPYNEIGSHLNNILNSEYVTVSFSIDQRSNIDWSMSMGGVSHPFHMGTDSQIVLMFEIAYAAMTTTRDIFSELESKLGDLGAVANCHFLSREVVPFRDFQPMTIRYTMRINDMDEFVTGLAKFALEKADKEFTAVLEKELDGQDKVPTN